MILLTGATGYIGSHVWAELLQNKFPVIGIDNLSNSSADVLKPINHISSGIPLFIRGDIRDENFLTKVFKENNIRLVIHLAALKNIQQSMRMEREYFDVNINGLKTILAIMHKNCCKKIIFGSSAAVYDSETESPKDEFSSLKPLSIYGKTKLIGEKLISESCAGGLGIQSIILRYFNVEGRHSSGFLTNNAQPCSGSLFSEIYKIFRGEKDYLTIYGDNWNTSDGTCVRDYIHVSDLSTGHIKAINLLEQSSDSYIFNLGTGIGNSVKNVIAECEKSTKKIISYKVLNRRAHEVGVSYANINLAKSLLRWSPNRTIHDICKTSFGTF